MNIAHIFGEHYFSSQGYTILHTIMSWLPIIATVCIAIAGVVIVHKQLRKLALQPERVRKNK